MRRGGKGKELVERGEYNNVREERRKEEGERLRWSLPKEAAPHATGKPCLGPPAC